MKSSFIVTTVFLLFILSNNTFAQKGFNCTATVSVSADMKTSFVPEGRMFLFLSESSGVEPRTQTWPNPGQKTYIFARNFSNSKSGTTIKITAADGWTSTADWSLDNVPAGTYYAQVLWDQDQTESTINAPGNLYSTKQKVNIEQAVDLNFALDQQIEPRSIMEHELLRVVDFKSETLSSFWEKPMHLKASVLLPHNYDNTKAYPIRYNVAGYGGRYTRVNRLLRNKNFVQWWDSAEAPQVISVFLDGEGPFGDSYQMDSENSGPYGEALINELIPHIETAYRGTNSAQTRFVDGCSTGGWVSLGLQLYYPDFFNGVFSYSPDAVEFENYQLINIYEDKNAFVNEFGYDRPVMRSVAGEPMLSMEEFIQYENVQGASNTYLNSGGQFSAHTALYSPKGKDGLPQPLFDPQTGEIDPAVAEHWKKYDFKLHAEKNWGSIGTKLQGKIYVWMGDMDNFYLNPATRAFADFLKTTTGPVSDAEIVFSPMEGHCWQFSDKAVLLQIQERLKKIQN